MLVKASWVEKVKKVLGITAVSQVWGEKPAWYFWISETPGVYHLQMETGRQRRSAVTGLFSIKCYPYPYEKVCQSFSAEERDLVQSDFFDHTNTPRLDQLGFIPETLFGVGVIEHVVDLHNETALFTFEAPDIMRIRYEQETVQQDLLIKRKKRFRSDEIAREVPAWQIGYMFFDRLLSLYAHYSNRKPGRVVLSRSRGFEYVHNETDGFACVDSNEIWINTLTVLFPSHGEPAKPKTRRLIDQYITDGEHEVVYDRTFRDGHFHVDHGQIPPIMTLNEQWWNLAGTNYKSELVSTCGCAL